MPFRLESGSAGGISPTQIGPTGSNSGLIHGFTSINSVSVKAQLYPSSGSNTYGKIPTESVRISSGIHVPVVPLKLASGNSGGVSFWQSGSMGANCGMITVSIWMVITKLSAQMKESSGLKTYSKLPGSPVSMVAGVHLPNTPLRLVSGNAGGVLN